MIVRALPVGAVLALLLVSLSGAANPQGVNSPASGVETSDGVANEDERPLINAPDDAQALLEQMNSALEARAFSGTLVVFREGRLDAVQIRRTRDAGEWKERIFSLSGAPVHFERNGDDIRLAGSGRSSTWSSPDGDPYIGTALGLRRKTVPAAHYELVVYGSDRVAGRPARVVDIRPRDGFRYGYRLWLDRESSLPLKSLTIGADGRPIEQFMFAVIEISPQPADAEAADTQTGSATGSAAGTRDSRDASAGWQVLDAPAGFSPILVETGQRTHLLFTDGVARVSVYVEPVSTAEPNLSGQIGRGAMHAFGRVAHGQQIIVMGDVPASTVERLAQGLVPIGGSAER